ncbi:hypothetical protein FE257_009561 [Aspergillus nanangensis]|uniref:GPI anchored serine-threonine rich protein n=1 Tax=Aspergillus nanangensis TaxID=2582783 RepID=A0AAD4GSN0_ASPNN|nr:hypothetical protein FE257_009561 [Aspergillus nanangensis]
MHSITLPTLLLATTALASTSPARLFARQTVEVPCSYDGMVECGTVCIEPTYTCCSIGVGGCAPGTYCTSDGCCPNGKICTGPGGTDINTKTFTFTDTLTNTLTNTDTATEVPPPATTEVPPPATTEVPPTTTSKPVIPPSSTAEGSSSVAVPSPSGSSSSTGPESPVFTGGASGAKVVSVGGLVAGVMAVLL